MNNQWLSELKEGDKVVIYSWGFSYNSYKEEVVQKITPKGFIKVNDILFKPDSGYSRSGGSCLLNPNDNDTKEKLENYKKSIFIRSVLNKTWNVRDLTYEQAIKIYEILNEGNSNDNK